MNTSATKNILSFVIGLIIVLGIIIGGIVLLIKRVKGRKQLLEASVQLNRTGKFAFWLGIIEILVIPLYYFLYKLQQPNITSQELIGELVFAAAYQLIIATILIVYGRKLRFIIQSNLEDAKKPLKWLTGVVIAGLVLWFINIIASVKSGSSTGGSNLLLLLFIFSISRSRQALKRQALSSVTTVPPPSVRPANPPSTPIIPPPVTP